MTNSYTVQTNRDFTIIQNDLIRDPNLSCKAFKLLCIGLSHAGTWNFYKKQIATCFKEGMHTVDSAMKELRDLGYLHLKSRTVIDEKTQTYQMAGHTWYWFESPVSEEEFKKSFRNSGFPDLGNSGDSENPGDIRRPTPKKTNLPKKTTTCENPEPKEVEVTEKSRVVVSFLDELSLSVTERSSLLKKLKPEQVELARKRLAMWPDRNSDGAALHTMLRKWDGWTDHQTEEEAQVQANDDRKKGIEELNEIIEKHPNLCIDMSGTVAMVRLDGSNRICPVNSANVDEVAQLKALIKSGKISKRQEVADENGH